jgi:peroxiredoxin
VSGVRYGRRRKKHYQRNSVSGSRFLSVCGQMERRNEFFEEEVRISLKPNSMSEPAIEEEERKIISVIPCLAATVCLSVAGWKEGKNFLDEEVCLSLKRNSVSGGRYRRRRKRH